MEIMHFSGARRRVWRRNTNKLRLGDVTSQDKIANVFRLHQYRRWWCVFVYIRVVRFLRSPFFRFVPRPARPYYTTFCNEPFEFRNTDAKDICRINVIQVTFSLVRSLLWKSKNIRGGDGTTRKHMYLLRIWPGISETSEKNL